MQFLASAFIAINCCLHLGQTVPWSLDVGWQKWENSPILRYPFRDNRSRARRQPIKIRCPHLKLFWFNSLAIFNWFAWEANRLPQYYDMPSRTIRLVIPRSQGNKKVWKNSGYENTCCGPGRDEEPLENPDMITTSSKMTTPTGGHFLLDIFF